MGGSFFLPLHVISLTFSWSLVSSRFATPPLSVLSPFDIRNQNDYSSSRRDRHFAETEDKAENDSPAHGEDSESPSKDKESSSTRDKDRDRSSKDKERSRDKARSRSRSRERDRDRRYRDRDG